MKETTFYVILMLGSIVFLLALMLSSALNNNIENNKEVKISCIEQNKTYAKVFFGDENIGLEYCGNIEEINSIMQQFKEAANERRRNKENSS